MTDTTEHGGFQVRLAPEPASVPAARRLVRDLLSDAHRADLLEPAELVVSEIVTNALLHAGTDIDLSAELDESGVLVAVGDGSSHLPSRRQYAATSGTGRGLMMLESLVDDWGVTRHHDGKTVWFHVSDSEPDLDLEAVLTSDDPTALTRHDREVRVVFENMPLLLHAAWQVHAETLLRELVLASLDDEGIDSIQVHADATDAIAVLEEHVPRAVVAFEPDALMRGVAEPLVTARRVVVPVPVASVPHFDTLDQALESAVQLSEEGLVLAPPTQPEMQSFRRWVCREVRRQAGGGAPQQWTGEDSRRRAPVHPDGFDVSTVTRATNAVVAANDDNQIIAVSEPAAELLGHRPEDMVGMRLVEIIPERFRQAHVAGFTMYLFIGRKPLLGHPVRVPALRRDGTEVQVELLVREHPVGQGRLVLVADLRPL